MDIEIRRQDRWLFVACLSRLDPQICGGIETEGAFARIRGTMDEGRQRHSGYRAGQHLHRAVALIDVERQQSGHTIDRKIAGNPHRPIGETVEIEGVNVQRDRPAARSREGKVDIGNSNHMRAGAPDEIGQELHLPEGFIKDVRYGRYLRLRQIDRLAARQDIG